MKTINLFKLLCASSAVWMCSIPARSDDAVGTPQKLKNYSGIVTFVDSNEKLVTVKAFPFRRTFNVAESCAIAAGDKPEANLNDLRSGQKVDVKFKNAHGVFVATRIAQEKLSYTGSVESIYPEKHVLKVSRRGFSKIFRIPADCKVVLKDDKSGSLDDVKTGHVVTVVYEIPKDSLVARQIEQTSATFVGTLDAIDASTRMVKAKHVIGDERFNLADNCKIAINGKPNASLNDLRLGQKLTFSYDEVDGVNVVTRIASAEGSAVTETASSEKAAERAQK